MQSLCRLELGPDGIESRLQDGSTIDSVQTLSGSAGVDERGIDHTDETEHRAEVRLDEVHSSEWRSWLVDAARGHQNRGPLVQKQTRGSPVLVREGLAHPHDLVN